MTPTSSATATIMVAPGCFTASFTVRIYGPVSLTRSSCGTGAALPSSAPSVGVKNSATASDAESVAIKVIGRYFMNCPTTPGQNNSGENAATRVTVAAITGPDIRLAASE